MKSPAQDQMLNSTLPHNVIISPRFESVPVNAQTDRSTVKDVMLVLYSAAGFRLQLASDAPHHLAVPST